MSPHPEDGLRVRRICAGYGSGQVLQGVDVDLPPRSACALLGRNGVGKTTLALVLTGLLRASSGTVHLDHRALHGLAPHQISRAGVRLVPQGRRVFASVTVEQNLRIAAGGGGMSLGELYEFLPLLFEYRRRRGNELSGGEQQMIAIGRALLARVRVLVLDEPFEGLAPLLIDRVAEVLRELRERGTSMLLIEQNIRLALELTDEVLVLNQGQILHRGNSSELVGDAARIRQLLGAG